MKEIGNEISIKRKCSCCGEYLYITKNSINKAVYYDKKTYHSDCFDKLCQKRIISKRANVSEKWIEIYNRINLIKSDTYEHFVTAITQEEIFQFIKETYDLKIIPTPVWQKLSNIYAGTFKGMTVGISPMDLIDMWHRKIDMLNGIAKKNELKGIKMLPEQRLTYDLSILINKYDSYLRWKEKQKILEAEKKQGTMENIVNQSVGYIKPSEETLPSNTNDISDLVDDIFR